MPYIGRGISQLQTIDKLDAITPSTSTGAGPYNLTQSSSAFTPISANNLLISINGVVQYGNFTVAGSTVTFTGALSDSDTCNFILHVGEGVVNTPGAGTVSTSTIAADAVTGAKIADDAIDSEHFTDGSIDTAHIAADAVTGAKIADDAIDSEHYTDGSIDTAHIADLNVTQAKIANEAINEAKLQVSNTPTNGYFLSAQSGNTGGLTWAEAGGGAYIHLQTQTVSSGVAQVDFTSNLATYDTIKFVFSGVHPATDNVTFLALVSTDGGSSYLSTTYNAAGAYLFSASSNGDQGNASDKIILNGACGNATNESQSGFLEMNNLASTTYYKNTQSLVTGVHDTGALIATHGGCSIHQTSAINGVRFKFSSGNIDAGTFSLYGVKRS